MSTPALIGTIDTNGDFRGRYVHWSGYPTYLGPRLTHLIAAHDGALAHVLDVLTHQHTYWSELTANPGPPDIEGLVAVDGFGIGAPAATAPPDRDFWLDGTLGRNEHAPGGEWGYVFTTTDPATAELVVLGFMDTHHGRYDEAPAMQIARIPVPTLPTMTGPRWTDVECGTALERCTHIAAHHYDLADPDSAIDTAAYLGLRPLDLDDARTVRRKGRTYRITGGRRGGYAGGGRPGTWYGYAIDTADNSNHEFALWRYHPESNAKIRIPGVTYLMPELHPDPDNPQLGRKDRT